MPSTLDEVTTLHSPFPHRSLLIISYMPRGMTYGEENIYLKATLNKQPIDKLIRESLEPPTRQLTNFQQQFYFDQAVREGSMQASNSLTNRLGAERARSMFLVEETVCREEG